MTTLIEGYTEANVMYCPYCGEKVTGQDSEGKCSCNKCENEYYVVIG